MRFPANNRTGRRFASTRATVGVALALMVGALFAVLTVADIRAETAVVLALVVVLVYLSVHARRLRRAAELAAISAFLKTLEAKDPYTKEHTERVAYFSELISVGLGLSTREINDIRWAALIHDLGKVAVPTDLIRKRGPLTEEEYEAMQDHAHMVEDLLAEVDFLQPMVEIASGHHSHYDGSGYGGRGHKDGESPTLAACVVAVADAFDAMTSARSYRAAMSQEYALAELRRNSGGQFHPEVVAVFETALSESGRQWGAPGIHDERLARRIAENPRMVLDG